jgi:hypothetical protein
MSIFRHIGPVLLAALFAGSLSAAPTADSLMNEAKQKARTEEKSIFLMFSTTTCGWCKVLKSFLDSEEVKPIFAKYFVPVQLMLGKDQNTNPGGEVYEKKYGPAEGVPYHLFLKPDGEEIIDSKEDGTGGNIGYPAAPNEIAWFMKMVKKAAPRISDKDLAILEAKLKSFRKS